MIGYEQSEQLDVEPARYFVLVIRREKRACKSCAEGVTAAPLPERIIEKGLVSDRVVIDSMLAAAGEGAIMAGRRGPRRQWSVAVEW